MEEKLTIPEKLTVLDAFRAATVFLRAYFYRSGEPDDIGGLLGSMGMASEPDPLAFTPESLGYEPLDRGVWQKWLRSINTIIPEKADGKPRELSIPDSYKAMYLFIQKWYEAGLKSEEPFRVLMEKMELWKNGSLLNIDEWLSGGGEPHDPTIWTEWLESIKLVTEQ